MSVFPSNVSHQDSSLGLFLTFPYANIIIYTNFCRIKNCGNSLQSSVQTAMKVQAHLLFKLTDGFVLEMHSGWPFCLKTFDYLLLFVKFMCDIYQHLF